MACESKPRTTEARVAAIGVIEPHEKRVDALDESLSHAPLARLLTEKAWILRLEAHLDAVFQREEKTRHGQAGAESRILVSPLQAHPDPQSLTRKKPCSARLMRCSHQTLQGMHAQAWCSPSAAAEGQPVQQVRQQTDQLTHPRLPESTAELFQ